MSNSDILDRLAVYAPTPTSIAGEWGSVERAEGLAAVLDDESSGAPTDRPQRLRFIPAPGARRTRAIAPIAASVAVLVLAGGAAVLADREHGSGPRGIPAGRPGSAGATTTEAGGARTFHATVATPRLGAHQWAYRAVSTSDTSAGSGQSAQWLAPDGSGRVLEDKDDPAGCVARGAVPQAELDEPTQAFVDALPSDPADLKAYLIQRVQGSTSREEAIFTAAGDLLRAGDLLASSEQRAALVTVLAGLQRASVHDDADERGRAAVRIDFVDPNQRGGEIQSLYFDTRTFQLLEERDSTSSAAVPSDEPSAPYSSVPSQHATTPQQLTGKGSVTIVTAEQVVDTLPSNCGVAR